MRNPAVIAERSKADSILSDLLQKKQVEETLKIKAVGDKIIIPVRVEALSSDVYNISEDNFEPRHSHRSPQSLIREELDNIGMGRTRLPERWVRLGSSVMLKFPDGDEEKKKQIAEVYSRVLRVESVYEITGRIRGDYREPEMQLLHGPGGEVTHIENRISYTFDPSRIMFSPGNVNIRTSVRNMELEGKTVIDMFAGIGYFSLGIAKYTKPEKIHACEINPRSFGYLEGNIRANHVEAVVTPHLGDSRTVCPEIKADVVVMGNFLAFTYMPHALARIKSGGHIIMHDIVSTDLIESYRYRIYNRLKTFGWIGRIEEMKTVKSFAPHMWHIYVKLKASSFRM